MSGIAPEPAVPIEFPEDDGSFAGWIFLAFVAIFGAGVAIWVFGPRWLADNVSFVLVWAGVGGAAIVAFLFRDSLGKIGGRARPKTDGDLMNEFE